MNGPEHYREAERLLAAVRSGRVHVVEIREVQERAQVHATLALAAATAQHAIKFALDGPTAAAWAKTISVES